MKLDGNRYVGWKSAQVERIIKRQRIRVGRRPINSDDFTLQRAKRPFLLVNGAMNHQAELIPDKHDDRPNGDALFSWEHFEFTPWYSGIHRASRKRWRMNVGGGYLENTGLDTFAPSVNRDGSFRISAGKDFRRFALQDMMATSGAAPAYIFEGLRNLRGSLNLINAGGLLDIFPKYRVWPVQYEGKPLASEMPFGDGGYVDNHGIIPLLKRRVKKIVVLINTDQPLSLDKDTILGGEGMDQFLYTLFGKNVKKRNPLVPSSEMQPGGKSRNSGQVFSRRKFEELVDGFLAHQDGDGFRGAVFCRQQLITQANHFYGVPGGHRCEVLWVYNELNNNWLDELPEDTRLTIKDARRRDESTLQSFPHIPTFGARVDFGNTQWLTDSRLLKGIKDHGLTEALHRKVSDPGIDLDPDMVLLMASHSYFNIMNDAALRAAIHEMFGIVGRE